MRKMPADSEAAMIMMGIVPHLNAPIADFVRFRNPQMFYPEMPEIELPTRFIFVLLIPEGHPYISVALNIGRAFGSMMVDEVGQGLFLVYKFA